LFCEHSKVAVDEEKFLQPNSPTTHDELKPPQNNQLMMMKPPSISLVNDDEIIPQH
jgi:hypothetical protein